MNDTMTLKDFMVQCQLYEHSAEYYDLMKESCEIDLLERYIDNQLFMMENSSIFEGVDVCFEDGYFQESANDTSLEAIMEKADDKKKGLFGKIWDSFKKLVARFGAFLYKCATGKDPSDLKDKVKSLKKKCSENESIAKEFAEKAEALKKKYGIDLTAITTDSDESNGSDGSSDTNDDAGKKHIANTMMANRRLKKLRSRDDNAKWMDESMRLLEDDNGGLIKFHVQIINATNTNAMDPYELTEIMNKYIDALTAANNSDLDQVDKLIDAAIGRAKDGGITIDLKGKRCQKLCKDLETLRTRAEKTKGDTNNAGVTKYDNQLASSILGKLYTSTGETISAITKLISMRRDLIRIIEEINKKGPTAPKEDNSEKNNTK